MPHDSSPPLRVVVNDRAMCRTLTGVGNYIAQLLLHTRALRRDVALTPFVHTYLSRTSWQGRLAAQQAGGPSRQPADVGDARRPWWMRRALQAGYRAVFRALGWRFALYHEPNHIPIRCGLPTVTTIHDLSVLLHPEWHPADRVAWYEREFAAGLRQTRVVLAASENTRREVIEHCGVSPQRVIVTYQAPRAAFTPADADATRAQRRQRDLPERFFLFVGTLEPRKNLAGLLEAYAALPAGVRRTHPLLIAGAWGWRQKVLRERLAERDLAGDVRLLGYLHDPELATLYRCCTAFVWPTHYEGFGLPPLEALACGAAVVTSNTTSLPEVVGDAGVLLDPRDAGPWRDALLRLAEDEAYRDDLRRAAVRRAAGFTWDRFVDQTIAGYRQALRDS